MSFDHSCRQVLLGVTLVAFASCATHSGFRHPASGCDQSGGYPICVVGNSEASFNPQGSSEISKNTSSQDVVVVGSGLGGLSAAFYLVKHGKSVLMLEKEDHLGGLASWNTLPNGSHYDRGAAYWTNTYKEEQQILTDIGLGDFEKKYRIPGPIDSFLYQGKFYPGIWDVQYHISEKHPSIEEGSLRKLPASFELFKYEISRESEEKLIPDQPLEEQNTELDNYSASEWIRSMPSRMGKRLTPEARQLYAMLRGKLAAYQKRRDDALEQGADFKEDQNMLKAEAVDIWERFQHDLEPGGALRSDDPMIDVVRLMDLYCRSALGAPSDQVSALPFANFYISEIIPRYTTTEGTGKAAEFMERALNRSGKFKVLMNSTVSRLRNVSDGAGGRVIVTYVNNGKTYEAEAAYAVYAAQIGMAPRMIDGLKGTPQGDAMASIRYSHYSVHTIRTNGHPYRRTYDTWLYPENYTEKEFTDVILGRYVDPAFDGYATTRNFSRDPNDPAGVLTVYHPLPGDLVGKGYDEAQSIEITKFAIQKLNEHFQPLFDQISGDQTKSKIDIISVDTNRWPYSVHVASKGYYQTKVKIMRRPFGHIVFGHSNLGTPAFEEALFRGHCAADNILAMMDPAFKRETWSRCPIEKPARGSGTARRR